MAVSNTCALVFLLLTCLLVDDARAERALTSKETLHEAMEELDKVMGRERQLREDIETFAEQRREEDNEEDDN